MRLVVGDPLPDDQSILPDPEMLMEKVCCTVASKTQGGSLLSLRECRGKGAI